MIEGRLIICIGSAWDYDPTSKHQIMSRLGRHNDILWINYHGSRRPGLTRADLVDSCRALRRVARGLTRINDSMAQLTPLVIPGASHPLLQRWHQRLVTTQIARAVRTVDRGRRLPVQVWSFAPDVPYLVGAFDEECFIYYCVDEFALFEGFDPVRTLAAENELIDRADLVVASAEALHETKRLRRDDVSIVRHGVAYDHFAATWRKPLPTPPDVTDIPKPIFGFFGLIHHWIDLEFLAELASRRPGYSFVLIGDCKVNTSVLNGLENVHLLGRRSYEELPAYCAAFDAGLMLFRDCAMTRNVNPIKMYEYLAAGLPVVSTPLPEAERFSEVIHIAHDVEDYAKACDHIIRHRGEHDRPAVSRVVQGEDWSVKVEHLSRLVLRRCRGEMVVKSKPIREVLPASSTTPQGAPALR